MNKNFFRIALLTFVLTMTALSVWAGFGAGFGGSSTCCSIHYTVITQGDWDELFVSMSGDLQATCTNPSGNTTFGQRRIRVSQYDDLTSSTRERGTNSYEFVFDGPMDPPPSVREAGCPSNNSIVTRLTGYISGVLSVEGTNGRIKLFKTSCFYDSAVIGEMTCTITPV